MNISALRGDGIVEEARSLRRGGRWPVSKPPVQSGGVNGEKTMTKAGRTSKRLRRSRRAAKTMTAAAQPVVKTIEERAAHWRNGGVSLRAFADGSMAGAIIVRSAGCKGSSTISQCGQKSHVQ